LATPPPSLLQAALLITGEPILVISEQLAPTPAPEPAPTRGAATNVGGTARKLLQVGGQALHRRLPAF
jgi:hypothetical protein